MITLITAYICSFHYRDQICHDFFIDLNFLTIVSTTVRKRSLLTWRASHILLAMASITK